MCKRPLSGGGGTLLTGTLACEQLTPLLLPGEDVNLIALSVQHSGTLGHPLFSLWYPLRASWDIPLRSSGPGLLMSLTSPLAWKWQSRTRATERGYAFLLPQSSGHGALRKGILVS